MILAKDSIRKAIENFINGYKGVHIIDLACPNTFEQVCDENGWIFEMDLDYNGWQVDWWAKIIANDITINVSGSMYYGDVKLEYEG
jgi:hypothetical protein